jgi:hypothetical protein
MTQRQIDRAVASATGESLAVVRRMGFGLVEQPDNDPPNTVDWDTVDARRIALFPDRQNRHAAAARRAA